LRTLQSITVQDISTVVAT
nr:immunoglobulin heavy chain junction region [Mus musculus]